MVTVILFKYYSEAYVVCICGITIPWRCHLHINASKWVSAGVLVLLSAWNVPWICWWWGARVLIQCYSCLCISNKWIPCSYESVWWCLQQCCGIPWKCWWRMETTLQHNWTHHIWMNENYRHHHQHIKSKIQEAIEIQSNHVMSTTEKTIEP